MHPRVLQVFNRLEALSLRERIFAVVGVPLVLVLVAEAAVFGPARTRTAAAQKQVERQQGELKALEAVLAAQPVATALPKPDQLLRQRAELQAQIDEAQAIVAALNDTVAWGAVVRSTVAGTPGLTLVQLKTLPPELVYSPVVAAEKLAAAAAKGAAPRPGAVASGTTAKPAAAAASAPAAAPLPTGESIYRHRAEMTVKGDFAALLGYLQTLQGVPGDLRWDRMQLSAAGYPQASLQLTLYTLSNRAETPFN